MSHNKLLYIGLNGYAGAGKDTVAKMMCLILNHQHEYTESELFGIFSRDMAKYKYATTGEFNTKYSKVINIAYADQLKELCSVMFGIPVRRFYDNKSNGYINISGDFSYTESKPFNIITAEDYASGPQAYQNSSINYWMSLREVLVYVGTYVLQNEINRKIFINIVNNKLKNECKVNSNLKYAIITDIRFQQEFDYIQEKKGITINITRDDLEILPNIAEHSMEDEVNYDIVIENNGTYEELFHNVYEIIHNHDIFKNDVVQLISHDNTDNFLRLEGSSEDDSKRVYRLCMQYDICRLTHASEDSIAMVDPSGGPAIYKGQEIDNLPGYIVDDIITESDPFKILIIANRK